MVRVKSFSLGYLSKSAMFAKNLGHLSSKQFYLVIGQIGNNHKSKLSWSGWSNAQDVASMGPYFANYKVSEFPYSDQTKIHSKTPIPDFKNGYGYRCFSNSYVAVGNLSQEHNELLAAIILYKHLYQGLKLYLPSNSPSFRKSYNEYFFNFIVDDIKKFLSFLSQTTNTTPEYWSDSDDLLPKGGLFVTDSQDSTLGVICHPSFWDLEDT